MMSCPCLRWESNHLRTFERHPGACLQVEPLAGATASLLDVVAQSVAAVLPAVQTDALVEAAVVAAPVGSALLVLIQQRVDEEMDRSFVSAFHRLLETYAGQRNILRTSPVDQHVALH